jgi:hypothetical protein
MRCIRWSKHKSVVTANSRRGVEGDGKARKAARSEPEPLNFMFGQNYAVPSQGNGYLSGNY